MIRYILAATLVLAPLHAHAQQPVSGHAPDMDHGSHGAAAQEAGIVRPAESGQGAFAAIQEIVTLLDADPATDWTRVDIEGLRRHLIDMNNVTLGADIAAAPFGNGVRYTVTGEGDVRLSVRRMVMAHAGTMNGANGLFIKADEHPWGAVMTVTLADPADLVKLEGLGFIGVMTLGAHHQEHHLAIATGAAPHD
jgi:hypothetical protein